MVQKQLATLVQKEMTRKEFITTMGFGLASVFGFSTIVHLLSGKSLLAHKSQMGYGSSSYGGER
jgi:hypothetical protein